MVEELTNTKIVLLALREMPSLNKSMFLKILMIILSLYPAAMMKEFPIGTPLMLDGDTINDFNRYILKTVKFPTLVYLKSTTYPIRI